MLQLKTLLPLVCLGTVYAQSSSSSSSSSSRRSSSSRASTATAPSTSATGISASVSPVVVSTVVASASAAPDSPLPSGVAVPPKQAWCPSEIFCAGELLQAVNLAHPFQDQKTIVDKPTSKSSREVLAAFKNISASGNETVGQVISFLNSNFRGEGQELQAVALTNFDSNPAFLANVTNPVVKGFSQAVHNIWKQLIRTTNESTLCPAGGSGKCESSLIPLNHTFVVPGGRFREQYYWDSFWIVEGLLESELYSIVNATLQNFMDELDTIGFIPNGGRIYYLDRSQPPLFIQMLDRYVKVTKDTSILKRALPLAEKELRWWSANRQINVTSPFTNQTHKVYRYAVVNSAPRPESYFADYDAANNPSIQPALNLTQRSDLYAELATGAESGWDYTTRWLENGSSDLKTLHLRSLVAVDLNSILYRNHIIMADLYGNARQAAAHRTAAAALKKAVLDLLWDSEKLAFYDFNIKTKARNTVFTVATFYPFWSGIIPEDVLKSSEKAFGAFSTVNLVMNRYNGTYPTTFIDTGLQWDAPNTWPPHQYVVIAALRALPSNITSSPLPTPSGDSNTFSLIPSGQLGLEESALPGQPIHPGQNASTSGAAADLSKGDGTVSNGGNKTEGEGWGKALERQMVNRYVSSALCSWRATGGSIEGLIPRLGDDELNVTASVGNTGNMFEKFSNTDIDSAGRGGEYTVQAGFGWTNGVLLWIASNYGSILNAPSCPSLLAAPNAGGPTSPNGGNGSQTPPPPNAAVAISTSMRAPVLVALGAAVVSLVL